MRVTESYKSRVVVENLNLGRERLNTLEEQLASGKRINRPSDDPLGATNALKLRSLMESNDQFVDNIVDSISNLETTETALNDVHNLLLEMKDIATRGANDATIDREGLAKNIDLLLDNMVEVANTKFQGKYIFAGTKTLSKPYQLNTNERNFPTGAPIVNAYGNDEHISRQINENTVLDINISNREIFDKEATGGVNTFSVINDLRVALENDDTSAINASIDKFGSALDQSLTAFLDVGLKKQLVIFNQDRFSTQEINIKSKLSQIEDTDFGETFIKFKTEENALNSALSAGAKVLSPSLGDYLR